VITCEILSLLQVFYCWEKQVFVVFVFWGKRISFMSCRSIFTTCFRFRSVLSYITNLKNAETG